MKNIYKILCLLLLACSISSCENWFDVTAKSELKGDDMLSNRTGYRDALIGCYATMAGADLYGSQLTMTYMDVLGQYYSTAKTALNNFSYAVAYDYSNLTEESRKDGIWKDMYNVVANANNILDHIDGDKGVFMEGEYEVIKGEALAIRAYMHLDLLRLFAKSPSMTDGLQSKAIPYVDHFTNQIYPQLTVEQVLDRIIADLTAAQSLLKDVDPYGPKHAQYDLKSLTGLLKGREYRLNYYAVTALKARALLYRGKAEDLSNAGICAKEVIDSGLFPLVTSADIQSSDDNGFVSENIFALESKELKDNVADKYFYVTSNNNNFLAANKTTINKVFPATLDMDYRLKWWIENTGSYYILSKYNTSKRIPLLKVSEMYLIMAETSATTGEKETWLNQLLYHRGLPDESLEGVDFKARLLQEYAKEFIGEGQLFYAYKRLDSSKSPVTNSAVADPEAVYVLPLPSDNTYFQ